MSKEIIGKINELDKSKRTNVNNQEATTSNENTQYTYVEGNNYDQNQLVYKIQIYACLICSRIPDKFIKPYKNNQIIKIREDGLNKFFLSEFLNKEEATLELIKIREAGYNDAFLTTYLGNVRQK